MTDIRRLLLVLILDQVACSWSVNLLRAPQDLDVVKDNSSVIVAGSVIQLFCSASGQFTAPHIQWTRNNITIPETAQLPHLMVKSRTENNTITSSLLTIYDFSSSDNGSYQCVASDSDNSTISQPLLLSAINVPNMLKITRELNNNTLPDRTRVQLGSSNISISGAFLRCSAEQPASSSFTAPNIMWLKDGTQLFGDGVRVVINTTNSTIGTSNRTLSFVRIFNFSQSDAGVYQCVFYDTPPQGGEVITTRPYKVDTGPIVIKFFSLLPITLPVCSPDPLVIQVEAGGEYAGIQWTRTPIALNVSNGELVDFQQTFVRTVTSAEDWGLYTVRLVDSSNSTLSSVNISANSGSYSIQPSTCVYGGTSSSLSTFSPNASLHSSSMSSTPDSTSRPLAPSPSPSSSGGSGLAVTVILATSVPVSVVVILLILVASLLSGMAMVRCWWGKRKDTLQITNPMAMKSFKNSSDTSSNGKWSFEMGHTLHHSEPRPPQEDSPALPGNDQYATPNHTYEALPSLPPRQPIFEDLAESNFIFLMRSHDNTAQYSVVGPPESLDEGSSVMSRGVVKCDETQREAVDCPTHPPQHTRSLNPMLRLNNPQYSSGPWSPPNVDVNWYRASP